MIGGLGFLVRISNFLINSTDSPQTFVAASMLDDDTNKLRRSQRDSIMASHFTQVQERPCAAWQSKIATSKLTPKCCRDRCGGKRERLLNHAHNDLSKEMYVNNLLGTVRAHTGILKEKFKMNERVWKETFNKHKWYSVNDQDLSSESLHTDSSMRS